MPPPHTPPLSLTSMPPPPLPPRAVLPAVRFASSAPSTRPVRALPKQRAASMSQSVASNVAVPIADNMVTESKADVAVARTSSKKPPKNPPVAPVKKRPPGWATVRHIFLYSFFLAPYLLHATFSLSVSSARGIAKGVGLQRGQNLRTHRAPCA